MNFLRYVLEGLILLFSQRHNISHCYLSWQLCNAFSKFIVGNRFHPERRKCGDTAIQSAVIRRRSIIEVQIGANIVQKIANLEIRLSDQETTVH